MIQAGGEIRFGIQMRLSVQIPRTCLLIANPPLPFNFTEPQKPRRRRRKQRKSQKTLIRKLVGQLPRTAQGDLQYFKAGAPAKDGVLRHVCEQ